MTARYRHLVIIAAGLLASGCAAPQDLQFTAARYDTSPVRAEAWVRDIESANEMMQAGSVLFAEDTVKRTAVQYCDRGNALIDRGELRLALRAKSEALYLAQKDDDLVLSAHCAAGVALAYDYAQDSHHSIYWAAQAMDFLARSNPRKADQRPGYIRTVSLKALADASLRNGEIGRAAGLMSQALDASAQYTEFRPWVLLGMANVALAKGDPGQATKYIEQADAARLPTLGPVANRLRGQIALDGGDSARADTLFAASAQAATPVHDDFSLALALRGRARVALVQQHTAQAVEFYRAAIAAADLARATFHTEEFRSSTFGSLSIVFDEAIETLVDTGDAAAAFDTAEQARARALTDLIRERAEAGAPRPATSTELQQALARRPATVVLSYYVLPRAIILWTVRAHVMSATKIELGRPQLDQQVRAFRDAIVNRRQAEVMKLAGDLWQRLVQPAALARGEEVLILPHGPLHYLPFAALRDTDWLIKAHAIAFAPSATAWLGTPSKTARTPNMLAIGNPKIPDAAVPSLPGAEAEVAAIQRELPGARVLVGDAATRSQVVALAPEVDILHLATHAYFDAADPIFSAVLLSGPTLQQSRLEAHDIYQLQLRHAPIVTLSACDTGMGWVANGDEFYGVASAFLAAGAADVVATLWPIGDASTPPLMTRFYHGLVGGISIQEALRRAQIAAIDGGAFTGPVDWAAFEVIGAAGRS